MHILLLRAASHNDITVEMKNATRDVLSRFECTYDEVIVPSASSMPVAIGTMVDNMIYDGILCLGITINTYNTLTCRIMFEELVRNLNELSSYLTFPVGCGIYHSESNNMKKEDVIAFAKNEAENVCNTIRMIAQLNNFSNTSYARERDDI